MMKKEDFYFELPQELIAQDPLEDRSGSRLLVLDKESGEIEHRTFRDIKEENPTREELSRWHQQSGLPLKRFFNTSGRSYQALGQRTGSLTLRRRSS